MKVACFTSFTFSYLSKARVLADSLKKQHPDWDFVALITDEPPEEIKFSPEAERFDEVIWSKDLGVKDFDRWIRSHNIVEACTAVKGAALHHLSQREYDVVIYLDPDIAVFGSLISIIEQLQKNEILLTPHQLDPEDENDYVAIRDNELCSQTHGIYNLGFVAIRCHGEGVRFAKWWSDRLYKYCKDDTNNGMFTDQKWCDLVPAFFDKVKIVRDPGYNVASWNLSQRIISINESGGILVNHSPIKFVHFTKLGKVGQKMTERYAGGNTAVYELWSWYRNQVEKNEVVNMPVKYWAYGSL